MKKALAYALSLALVLSLAACSKPQADQPDNNQPDPAITSNQPDATTPETEQTTATQLSHTEQGQSQENILQGDELIAIFQHVYDKSKGAFGNEQDQITYEIEKLIEYSCFEMDSNKELPGDFVDRYVDWRPVDDFADEGTPYDERFAVTRDTVYATGTVNIREDTSTSSKQVGTLNIGESITRTGIGISGTTADGWARCELSNGQVVFISSSYLSLTKPATQSTSSATTTQAQGGGTPSGKGPSGGGATPPSGSEIVDPSTQIIGWSEEELASFDAFAKEHGMTDFTGVETWESGDPLDPRVHTG